jgi:CBS domain-containing membrane protein
MPDSDALPRWRLLLDLFRPAPVAADRREQARVAAGAALGILLTAALAHAALQAGLLPVGSAWPWLVAPMGASAVLVFAVPASPMAQPWAVVAGNTASALVGVACQRWLGGWPLPVPLVAALAVGAAIAVMLLLRGLHPPGGATALLAVVTGMGDPRFVLFPVLANALLLVIAGIVFNRATGRAYPHQQVPWPSSSARDAEADAVEADLDAVLARHNTMLDISRDELKALLQETQLRGYQRKLAQLRCSDIMSRQLVTVRRITPLPEAWALFRQHRIKALPVVDVSGGVVGIVTQADFLRDAAAAEAANPASPAALARRRQQMQDPSARPAAGSPTLVGQIMTRPVRVASMQRHLAELIPLFAGSGHHHIPIVDDADRLVGMVTQSDLVAALVRAEADAEAPPGAA